MRAKEFITERNYSGPLYHMTSTDEQIIHNILYNGLRFRKVQSETDKEHNWLPKKKGGYNFFLSASRSLTNFFRDPLDPWNKADNAKYSNVSLTLNTSYFNQKNFIIGPMDYYNSFYKNKKASEAEERIWSKEQYHPISCISEIHVLLYDPKDHQLRFHHNIKPMIKLYEMLQKAQIPTWFYDNRKSFTLHIKNHALSTVQIQDIFTNGYPEE